MATGDSYITLRARFRVGLTTIHKIIPETCQAIWDALRDEVMPEPTADHWKKVEEGFRMRWRFPNCLGALDGKHINIKAPARSGSAFYNYKKTFSTVLLALVDANYHFIYVDIGEYGSNSDGNVFKFLNFGKKYMSGVLNTPAPKTLPNLGNEGPMPHVIVADEAFPLRHDLMRPYPRYDTSIPKDEAIFNYRLSRTRMVVENAFGILTQRWRIFDRRIPLDPKNVDALVQACCCLHNFLTEDRDIGQIYADLNPEGRAPTTGVVPGIQYIPRLHGYRAAADAQGVRDIFKYYFNGPGAVTWQLSRVSFRIAQE